MKYLSFYNNSYNYILTQLKRKYQLYILKCILYHDFVVCIIMCFVSKKFLY